MNDKRRLNIALTDMAYQLGVSGMLGKASNPECNRCGGQGFTLDYSRQVNGFDAPVIPCACVDKDKLQSLFETSDHLNAHSFYGPDPKEPTDDQP